MSSIQRVVSAFVFSAATAATAAAQGPMELVVNIPAGRLDVIQGGERVRSYPVSVGTSSHATPTADASIRRVVFNPTWTPPPDAAWARNETPKGPGWGNPMGRVKLHLFDDYYVHGTPAGNERHLGRPASHGCIRMANRDVLELAQLVLQADGGASVSPATVQTLVRNPAATREVALAGRVRVRVVYRLTEVGGDSVTLHPDVYGRAGAGYAQRVRQELSAAGADAAPVLSRLASLGRSPASALRIARAEAAFPERDAPVVTVAVAATAAPAPQPVAVEAVALQR